MRRTIALTLISICVAGGAAGCSAAGSGGPHGSGAPAVGAQGGGSQATGTEQAMAVMRQWAHCIRVHGMPGWPDPVINPLTSLPDFPPGSPDIPASIQQACQPIVNRLPPDVQNSPPPTAAGMQALLRFARCMRSRGVPTWPDPNALGEFPLTTQIASQPAAKRGIMACSRYVPGGSQYLQLVQAASPLAGPAGTGRG